MTCSIQRIGKMKRSTLSVLLFGGNNRARTCDPLLVRQMLSQLSYAPIYEAENLMFTAFLVEATGLEPAASWSQTRHSTKLSYAST